MYSFPSTSKMREPLARLTNTGVMPTDLNARTGLFTPPAIESPDRSKSSADLEIVMALIVASRGTPSKREIRR